MINVKRRGFLGMGFAGLMGVPVIEALAVDSPYKRQGSGRITPALAAYSFRDYFKSMKGKPNPKVSPTEGLDMKGFIHLCAKYGVAAELTSYFFEPEVADTYLTECRREAHLNGVAIAGTAVGNRFTVDPASPEAGEQMTYVKRWIDRAVLMGAPHVRVFAGAIPKGMDEATAEKNAIEALKISGEYAASKGILLGIENHDSITSADRLLRIVTSVKNPWVGVNLDSGNFKTEDPYKDFVDCVPYAVNIQLKEELKIGDKTVLADLPRFFQSIKAGGYKGYVVLEYEGTENPYEKVPVLLAEIKRGSESA